MTDSHYKAMSKSEAHPNLDTYILKKFIKKDEIRNASNPSFLKVLPFSQTIFLMLVHACLNNKFL